MAMLRLIVLLLLARLLIDDVQAAHDWLGWFVVGCDVLLAACMFVGQGLDRAPQRGERR